MYFDEFKIGLKFYTEAITISHEEIVEFAAKFDPLPIHLDEDYAKKIYLMVL